MQQTNRSTIGQTDRHQMPKRRKPYGELDTAERWLWHSEVYAFRRIVLMVDEAERMSPCDPEGLWFDEQLIRQAAVRLRDQRDRGRRRREMILSETAQREGRALITAWARSKGYADVDAYAAAVGIEWIDAYREFAVERAALVANKFRDGSQKFDAAASLGVKAAEFAPTAEQMAAGRAALGLTEPMRADMTEIEED